MIILDFSSGNTCKNEQYIITQMIDQLAEVDKYRQCIIKWQLFEEAGENIPLKRLRFKHACRYAKERGFQTTASVFDESSLNFLLQTIPDVPFVKIPNRPDLYWLISEIPRKINVVVSHKSFLPFRTSKIEGENRLCCISKYPATIEEYEKEHHEENLKRGISDHTTNWYLYNKYKPEIYECHFKLEDSTGLDAGDFARTPEQIKEIL